MIFALKSDRKKHIFVRRETEFYVNSLFIRPFFTKLGVGQPLIDRAPSYYMTRID